MAKKRETPKTARKKTSKAKKSVKRTVKKKVRTAEIKKLRAEPIVTVEHERVGTNKIISGVSQGVSDLLGLDVNIVRILFLISFIFLIGIPIYAFLSLIMND